MLFQLRRACGRSRRIREPRCLCCLQVQDVPLRLLVKPAHGGPVRPLRPLQAQDQRPLQHWMPGNLRPVARALQRFRLPFEA